MRTQIEIDIPDGWEFVRWGFPKEGESYMFGDTITKAAYEYSNVKYIIVQRAWQWPDWLVDEFIAMDKTGDWYSYRSDPSINLPESLTWSGSIGVCLTGGSLDFTPPLCRDWRQSKRRRPT